MKLAGALVLLLFTQQAHASGPLRICADAKGLSVGGIVLSDSLSTIVAKLGKPARTGSYQGEDDGGVYTGTVLGYGQLEVNVDELRGIERIASLGPGARLPYGLRHGMSVRQTADILHFVDDGVGGNDIAVLPVCLSDTGAEVRLHFEQGALSSLEVVEYGP